MKTTRLLIHASLVATLTLVARQSVAAAAGPLPAWNDGKAKQAITAFVEKVHEGRLETHFPG